MTHAHMYICIYQLFLRDAFRWRSSSAKLAYDMATGYARLDVREEMILQRPLLRTQCIVSVVLLLKDAYVNRRASAYITAA